MKRLSAGLRGQGGSSHLSGQNAACARIMRLVVRVAQMIHANAFVGISRMDKLAAADINADMRNATLISILEKDEVAGL